MSRSDWELELAKMAFAQQVRDQISLPAGLPSENSTSSAWQYPPADVAKAQSSTLPPVTDVAIIGSGITGTSVAHTMLNHPSAAGLRITILEARDACSGATGRNGGHLVSDTCGRFEDLVNALGTEEATRILRFSEANITELKALVSQLEQEERDFIELREVNATDVVMDKKSLEEAKRSLELLQATIPDTILKYGMTEDQDIIKNEYMYRDGIACFTQEGACALWPYRLVTILQKRLLDLHHGRFSLETNTAVTSVSYQDKSLDEHGYLLQTTRGPIKAKTVIHCTNGYASHLLPSLTGKLYPLRGTMSVQDPGATFPRVGDRYSWTQMHQSRYDPETKRITTGLYYAQQNALTGDIFIGGESQEVENLLTSDDSTVATSAKDNISSIIPKIYSGADGARAKMVWSGIMGFTTDWLPMVGHLGQAGTGQASNEWIAAGFNGHGMDKCWLTGQAVARMALGEEVPSWFPKSYLLTSERLKSCTLDASVALFQDTFFDNSAKI
ncbi:hypothetical protein LCI18_010925 [Fusarium solani-melongenae]|uniref:Uncharacterized protein n=1 Tax=Fusarium solani subsp. cucurbitae TaxID=2747967 RepID=A0ACD3ZFJ5_FUSSC|nr:hypothetical protein LCI18_010925 [Fusarium solani-melongenae]